jgi:hypothetical protein
VFVYILVVLAPQIVSLGLHPKALSINGGGLCLSFLVEESVAKRAIFYPNTTNFGVYAYILGN